MRNLKLLLSLCVICLFFVSCANKKSLTRVSQYPNIYKEKPVSIVIMPPINKTNFVEVKEYFYASMYKVLAEKGYYVFSPYLAMDLFKSESAYDSELFIKGSLKPFRNIIGADLALFTIINKWEKQTLLNKITVNIEYIIRSTRTGEILFNRKGELTISEKSSSGISILDMAANILTTALTDKIIVARKCNNIVLQDLPEGKYGLNYEKDQNVSVGNKEINLKLN